MKSTIDKKNVVGIARGEKWTNGKPTGADAVLVFVEKKIPLSKLSPDDIVESHIDGLPTDVVGKTGQIRALELLVRERIRVRALSSRGRLTAQKKRSKNRNPRKFTRPIMGGISVSHRKVTAGTIGGLFRDRDKDVVMLSNNHVLANTNAAKAGNLIYQPGTYDRRVKPNGVVGYLKDFVKLRNGVNQDSAIAKVTTRYKNYVNFIGRPRFTSVPKVGMKVTKSGRTTRRTTSRIIAVKGRFKIWYSDTRHYVIKNCIVTRHMSDGGDSGSLLLNTKRRIIGLLFAGSGSVTLHNPIRPIMRRYGLSFL